MKMKKKQNIARLRLPQLKQTQNYVYKNAKVAIEEVLKLSMVYIKVELIQEISNKFKNL